MKNYIPHMIIFLFLINILNAKPIDENTAMMVGGNFLSMNSNKLINSTTEFKLIYIANSEKNVTTPTDRAIRYFYIFNVNEEGFIIISADDNASPILGYSLESRFELNKVPKNVAKWLEGYKSQMRYIIENNIEQSYEIADEWNALLSNKINHPDMQLEVTPLLQTKWNQSPYVNDQCPFDNDYNERTVTGCVATAMAQVMKYWNYPEKGLGFHSYNHSKYGTLSANFGSTTYQWSSMPNIVSSPNNAVATLMFQLGVSVDMNYGVGKEGGSGAFVISSLSPVTNCSEYALKTYFGYKNTLKGIARSNYNQTDWFNLIKSEIDARRPVLYAGFGSGGGHCFVADGYDNSNFIHFNWGWGGYYDGYFEINALNPGGVGTGGGTGGFNSGHQAVIGIEPPDTKVSYDIKLNNYVTLSQAKISYGSGFSVFTNILNNGTNTLTGELGAAVFDEDLNFIDFVEIKTGVNLPGGYTFNNDLEFKSNGMLGMVTGKYYISVFYKPAGTDWVIVENNGNYVNVEVINIVYSSDMELNSQIKVTPGTTVTKERAISVNANLINAGQKTFYGKYIVNLYDLDGKFVENIGTLNEANGLPPGYTYQEPYLTFSKNSLQADPGTYLLAVLHYPDGDQPWLTGSTLFQNPIKIKVQLPALQPDVYEVNDIVSEASLLPVTYSNNSAQVTTEGSNCHVGTDYDFYKVNLQDGYRYTIAARLHDANNSGNGKKYSLDALFSYSGNGQTWSDAYDDIPNRNFIQDGPGTAYFHVSPYFTGETGTYLLDIKITRTPSSDVKEPSEEQIKIIQNLIGLTIDYSEFEGKLRNIIITDLLGRIVYSNRDFNNFNTIQINTDDFLNGTYLIKFITDRGIITKKSMVIK